MNDACGSDQPAQDFTLSGSCEAGAVNVFVGLDDAAWWSFDDDKQEATAGFFVAFTAKQRVIFLYCAACGDRRKIAPPYELLTKAGGKTINIA